MMDSDEEAQRQIISKLRDEVANLKGKIVDLSAELDYKDDEISDLEYKVETARLEKEDNNEELFRIKACIQSAIHFASIGDGYQAIKELVTVADYSEQARLEAAFEKLVG